MATLMIRDETAGQTPAEAWPLQVPSERMTVRELIRERVYQEFRDAQVRAAGEESSSDKSPGDKTGGEKPGRRDFDAQALAHTRLVTPGPTDDWREHDRAAAEAFGAGGFLVLVGDRQAESLEESFDVRASTEVTFLKLTPLVGG